MNIVILMAGRASRFKEVGHKIPKPFVEVKGKPMVKWATDSLPYEPEHFIFIVLKEHIDSFQIDKKLEELYSDKIRVIAADAVTEGAACTALLAESLINNDEELIVYNSDQYFKCPIKETIDSKPNDVKGIIAVFNATHPRWSFVRTDSNGFAIETAEKIPISSHATAGLYYFSKGRDFVWAAKEMIRKNIRRGNEFYICPVYNELIARGDKLTTVECEFMWGLGTPEDVEYFTKYCKIK